MNLAVCRLYSQLSHSIQSQNGRKEKWRKVRDSNPGESCNSAGFPYVYSFRYRAELV